MTDDCIPITLVRRIESLRQQAAQDILWLVENCEILLVTDGKVIAIDNGETASTHITSVNERDNYLAIIALKKEME